MSLSSRLADMKPSPARVLVLDIETSPAQAFVWSLKPDYIPPGQIIEHSRVLCFAATWADDPRMMFHSEREGRTEMIEAAWRLLDEADIVVGYNHVRFDIPHLQREMVTHGYRPPSPWIDIDLLPLIRREFRFMSNKLGVIVDQLGLASKDDSGGFETWRAVLAGDDKAWATMERYCRQDTAITLDLYGYLKSWIRMPHLGLFTGDMTACAACGSHRLVPDGIARTKVSAWMRLACEDCGACNRLLTNGETRLA